MNLKPNQFPKLLYLFLLFWALSFYGQNGANDTEQFAESLQKLPKNNIADLVYLQTSKGIYETEEDVWFKAYVLDAQYFYPSGRSKTLFVQLIEDQTDQVVWEKKYEIESGFVNGHLFLKNALAEGIYTLVAYTSHSFEGTAKEFYAAKKLEVQKTIRTKPTVVSIEKDSMVHFTTFPEGGKLVSGIESTLAFKAVNSKGLPVNVSGTLFENDFPVLSLNSAHAGMGGFDFIPDSTKKYHIQLLGSDKKYDISAIETSGKVLHYIGSNNELAYFKVTQTDDLKEEKVYLRLQIRGVVYSIAKGILKKELVFKLPLKDLPQGIAEVTLFNQNLEPVAERLVYVNQEQKLFIKTELNQTGYTLRDKASLKIKVTDSNGQPIVAHLGLSVFDGIYQNKLDAKTIESHYLLSTQLKGAIYNPAYYFNEQNKDRKQALNLLMLTQGWRNYVWNETNLKEQSSIQPLVFEDWKAKVRFEKMKKNITESVGRKTMFVATSNEKTGKYFIVTDSIGVFTIGAKEFKKGEGSYTYLQLNTAENSKYRIDFSGNFFEKINANRKSKNLIYSIEKIPEKKPEVVSPFADRETITKLKEVAIISKKKGFRDKYIGKLDSLYRLDHVVDYRCINGILNCKNHPEPRFNYRDLTEEELLDMFNVVMVEGYYGKKVFYEAIYDEVTITDSSPDYRNTLFWKSDIITDINGEATVDFFCSDINSLFIGNIEGVDSDGLLGANTFEFKVKKRGN
ncbi:hypothetical protein [Flavobacterium eburneipallidum]|uniref:hypothetical protein n=1 Tax=Flavobacterium eburneipallidum TaxID=3003263 RepID=UPI002482B9BC|nr:hypothetical protein [Flavobacterium eburneipallidum]